MIFMFFFLFFFVCLFIFFTFDPGHSMYYKMACPPSNDSNKPAKMSRLSELLLRALWVARDPSLLLTDNRGSA